MELRDLQRLTVVKLREEALKHEGIAGVHGMQKDELIAALAPIYGIDLEAAAKASRERFAVNKSTLKQEIRSLKAQRDTALTEHDAAHLKQARQDIKKRKRTLRRLARQSRPAAV
jgi:hypothetical protein